MVSFPQELISSISGRISPDVEKAIRKLMATYASNITSILCQFPSQQVCLVCIDFILQNSSYVGTELIPFNFQPQELVSSDYRYFHFILVCFMSDCQHHRQPCCYTNKESRERCIFPDDTGYCTACPKVKQLIWKI